MIYEPVHLTTSPREPAGAMLVFYLNALRGARTRQRVLDIAEGALYAQDVTEDEYARLCAIAGERYKEVSDE